MNPFKYGTIVSGKDFCSRTELMTQVSAHVESCQTSVRKSVKRLCALEILFEYEDEYKFFNPFFRAWLLYNG